MQMISLLCYITFKLMVVNCEMFNTHTVNFLPVSLKESYPKLGKLTLNLADLKP